MKVNSDANAQHIDRLSGGLMIESNLASMPLPSETDPRTCRDKFRNKDNGKKQPYADMGGSSL